MRTITCTVRSLLYANSSVGRTIPLSPRISLAKHVWLPKRALCICLHEVQQKAVPISTRPMLHISRFLNKKKSRDGTIFLQDLTLTRPPGGGGLWPGGGAMLQLKVKRGTCRERESCFVFLFFHVTFIIRIAYTAFTCDVLADWFWMFVWKDHRCQQYIWYSLIFIFSRLFSVP